MEEVPTRIEPCFLDGVTGDILPSVSERLRGLASELESSVRPSDIVALRGVVMTANAAWSALIEGRAFDIEALAVPSDVTGFAAEGRAHIVAQREVDRLVASGASPVTLVSDIHRAFYSAMPGNRRITEGGEIVPGAYRDDVGVVISVGRHLPPSADRVAAFMAHWEKRYSSAAGRNVLAIPAAHHRLSFVHPFLDGNGRTARLVTHAMCGAAGIGAGGLWSVSRALGRDGGRDYLSMMDTADMPRQGALDGRGNLSLKALERFTEWMLVRFEEEMLFMRGLLERGRMTGGYGALPGLFP